MNRTIKSLLATHVNASVGETLIFYTLFTSNRAIALIFVVEKSCGYRRFYKQQTITRPARSFPVPLVRHTVLQLLSPVSHPWVNQYMQVVGHPDLSGWDAVAPAMIGDIVSAVITEFSRGISGESSSGRSENLSPWGGQTAQRAGFPSVQIVGQSPHGQYPRGDISSVTGAKPIGEATINNQGRVANENAIDAPNPVHMRGRESRSNEPRRKAKDHTPIPVIPAKFDELQGMTTAQLSRLLDDDIARGAHLQGMPSVVGMKELRTEVRKGNVATAQSTLSNQDKARALRGEAERLRLMLKELQTSYEGAQALMECYCAVLLSIFEKVAVP